MTNRTIAALLAAHIVVIAPMAAVAATQGVINGGTGESVPIHPRLDGQLRPQGSASETSCPARDGDEIDIVRGMKLEGDSEFWILVRVRSGPCSGTEGWIRGRQARPVR
jgi:hypothetical protein